MTDTADRTDPGALRIRKAEGYFGSGNAAIPGRLVLDGIDLLRGAFVRMDDYSLDAVAREVLGEGKSLAGEVHDRIGEIVHNYRHDLAAFARYARTDARLAFAIVERLKLVQLAFARSQLAGMTPDRVAASIASFDFLYLAELEPLGFVTPTVRTDDARVYAAQGLFAEAIREEQDAVRLSSDAPPYVGQLARLYAVAALRYLGTEN